MPSFKSMFVFTATITVIMFAGDWAFRHRDPLVVRPIVQGVAFTTGYLIEWPLSVRDSSQRRVNNFATDAVVMIAMMGLITSLRLFLRLG